MMSSTSGVSFSTGSVSLKRYLAARASKYIREMPSDLILFQPEAVMAPSRMDRDLLGMMSSGSTFIWAPRPVQVGQAPKGLLKENIRGVSSSMDTPQSSQA